MAYGPYSSREMHKFVRFGYDNHGNKVVDKPPFLSIGTDEKHSVPYVGKKDSLPDRWKYKTWKSPSRPQNAGGGYFGLPASKNANENFIPFSYAPDPYKDSTSYRTNKRPSKAAFESRDASRRDEFTSVIRTQQYREALRAEQAAIRPSTTQLSTLAASRKRAEEEEANKPKTYAFDRKSMDVPFNPKSSKDTIYEQTLSRRMQRQKRYGSYRPSSVEFGSGVRRHSSGGPSSPKPEYARVNLMRGFHDAGHIQLPDETVRFRPRG